MIKKVQNQKLF